MTLFGVPALLSPDGKRLLVAGTGTITIIRVDAEPFSVETQLEDWEPSLYSWVYDSKSFIWASDQVVAYEVETGIKLNLQLNGKQISSQASSPVYPFYAYQIKETLYIYNLSSSTPDRNKSLGKIAGIEEYNMAWSPDGEVLAYTSEKDMITLYNALTGQYVNNFQFPWDMRPSQVSWAGNQQLMLITFGGDLILFDIQTEKVSVIISKEQMEMTLNVVVVSPDGQQGLFITSKGQLHLISFRDSLLSPIETPYDGEIVWIFFYPDGRPGYIWGPKGTLSVTVFQVNKDGQSQPMVGLASV